LRPSIRLATSQGRVGDRIEAGLEPILLATQMRVDGIDVVVKKLRTLDRKALNKLKAVMRQSINPVAKSIAADVPSAAPLSGMNHDGVTRWTGQPRATMSFTPGRGKAGSTRLLSMKFTGGTRGAGGIGFDYAELAGSSGRPGSQFSKVYDRGGFPGFQHRVNGQGQAFNRGIRQSKPISGKGGFFVYDAALKRYPVIEGLGKRAIDAFMEQANRELQRTRWSFGLRSR
jgi:hypothetical protein